MKLAEVALDDEGERSCVARAHLPHQRIVAVRLDLVCTYCVRQKFRRFCRPEPSPVSALRTDAQIPSDELSQKRRKGEERCDEGQQEEAAVRQRLARQ